MLLNLGPCAASCREGGRGRGCSFWALSMRRAGDHRATATERSPAELRPEGTPPPPSNQVVLNPSPITTWRGRDADLSDADQLDRRGWSDVEEQSGAGCRGEPGGRTDRGEGGGPVRDAGAVRLRHRGRSSRREDDGEGLGRARLARDDDQPDLGGDAGRGSFERPLARFEGTR